MHIHSPPFTLIPSTHLHSAESGNLFGSNTTNSNQQDYTTPIMSLRRTHITQQYFWLLNNSPTT